MTVTAILSFLNVHKNMNNDIATIPQETYARILNVSGLLIPLYVANLSDIKNATNPKAVNPKK